MTTATKKLREQVEDAVRRAQVAESRAHWLTNAYEGCNQRLDEQNKVTQRLIGIIRDYAERVNATDKRIDEHEERFGHASAIEQCHERIDSQERVLNNLHGQVQGIAAFGGGQDDDIVTLTERVESLDVRLDDLVAEFDKRTEIEVGEAHTLGTKLVSVKDALQAVIMAQRLNLLHEPEHVVARSYGRDEEAKAECPDVPVGQWRSVEVTEPARGSAWAFWGRK